MGGRPPLTIFACTIPTEGAPSLRFLQEPALSLPKGWWVAMLRAYLILCGHVIKPTWRRHFRLPPLRQAQGRLFAKNAKERGTHCVGNARKIKSPGHPAECL